MPLVRLQLIQAGCQLPSPPIRPSAHRSNKMFKGKGWFTWGNSKPKQMHSLEHLKYLYNVLYKNQTVNEQNRNLLVESLRRIAEILIWGDQNDSSVFDFFLEKNMLSFFLKIMKQKCGSFVCVQLLQTLNILFENIRNETSLYYLLSNNHVNSIIVHKFDFSDEEVMAYYISFLKTLSFKLNAHTIHFFFNEHTNDFPLYTEAIKFFNHSEKMVRIAVRTLTLNVFKVDEHSMLKFVGDRTAVPYFSNLVWFIGNHVLEIDQCLRREIKDQQMLIRLDDLVAEHLDHLHYLNDILLLRIGDLNEILTDHLLNRLLIPLYIYSLVVETSLDDSNCRQSKKARISSIVSLFLLSQVFLIISYDSLVQQLVDIILNAKCSIFEKPEFCRPSETLEQSLCNNLAVLYTSRRSSTDFEQEIRDVSLNSSEVTATGVDAIEAQYDLTEQMRTNHQSSIFLSDNEEEEEEEENKEEEKEDEGQGQTKNESCVEEIDLTISSSNNPTTTSFNEDSESVQIIENMDNDESNSNQVVSNWICSQFYDDRPFLQALFQALESAEHNDHASIFSLCLLYAIVFNAGVKESQLADLIMPKKDQNNSIINQLGSTKLIDLLTNIIQLSCKYNSTIRLVTLELCIQLLKKICLRNEQSFLSDHHLAVIEQAKERSTSILRKYYRSESDSLFLELFEDEYAQFCKFKINVEFLMMDANLLLPPSQLSTAMMSGLHFTRRLPCDDLERTRYAIRVYFLVRNISLHLCKETETQLPICSGQSMAKEGDCLDLTNCDLIACHVTMQKDQSKQRRFMVINAWQLIIIEPDAQRLGWGVAKYAVQLQQIEVNADKDDSRSLLIQVHSAHSRLGNGGSASKSGSMTLRCVFDDHIRSMAAKQRLLKGRKLVKQRKMAEIARLIELQLEPQPVQASSSTSQRKVLSRSHSQTQSLIRGDVGKVGKGSGIPVPGVAVASGVGRSSESDECFGSPMELNNGTFSETNSVSLSISNGGNKLTANYFRRKPTRKSSISSNSSARGSRDSSPKPELPRNEIPLENLSPKLDTRKQVHSSDLDTGTTTTTGANPSDSN